MKLQFLGRGAGFNPAEGSTSAYFIADGEMFLIDSGESIFHTLHKRKLLNNVTALNIFITHTHADHVGSLGTLILYAFAEKKIPVTIVTGRNMAYLSDIRSLLTIFGLSRGMYRFADTAAFSGRYSSFSKVRYVKTRHCNELASCGIVFETDRGLVFYSGDINDLSPLVKIIKSGCPIDRIYIDSGNGTKPNPHHVLIHQINDVIPAELRPRVYCMHLSNSRCITEAQACGFNVVMNNG